ncbi:hypothetical protein CHS0354_015043 [Potamilus streckersoni]|uniref:Uncharacterized protein n=1 Tax=Potamilus streckersoni TaxID=2493646 RepID=A0AAE0WDY7_9BIVA|nr:hypothetical protein CHS0354_015043 [Potamilus streckersoni]
MDSTQLLFVDKAFSLDWARLKCDDIDQCAQTNTNFIEVISGQCVPNRTVKPSEPPLITNVRDQSNMPGYQTYRLFRQISFYARQNNLIDSKRQTDTS